MSATATLNEQAEAVKAGIRSLTVEPFKVEDLVVDRNNLNVGDRFGISDNNISTLLSKLGIKKNLQERSFANPKEKWDVLRSALVNVGHASNLAAIVDSRGNSVDIVSAANRESEELNYDERIDGVLNAIEESDHDFYSIHQDGSRVKVQTRDATKAHECSKDDIWETGVQAGIHFNSQEMSAFYLRLICGNGMTDTQEVSRRQLSHKNIGNQVMRYIDNCDFGKHLKRRVDQMKNMSASVHEALSIASHLDKDQREAHTPWYEGLLADYRDAGMPVERMRKAQQRLSYTNENLYDVFNTGTSLATHNREELGRSTCGELNKACGEIFKKGPNLALRTINPYANN